MVVGEGWHERAGGPHAEASALAMAGEKARGATLLVNLEPCSHFGRTAPCTEAILAAGIARVVCSVEDPDPRIGPRRPEAPGQGRRGPRGGFRRRSRAGQRAVSHVGARKAAVRPPQVGRVPRRENGNPDGRIAVDLGRVGAARRAPPARGARRHPRRRRNRSGGRSAPDAAARPVHRDRAPPQARPRRRPSRLGVRASSRRPAARCGSSRPFRSGIRASRPSATAESTWCRSRPRWEASTFRRSSPTSTRPRRVRFSSRAAASPPRPSLPQASRTA